MGGALPLHQLHLGSTGQPAQPRPTSGQSQPVSNPLAALNPLVRLGSAVQISEGKQR